MLKHFRFAFVASLLVALPLSQSAWGDEPTTGAQDNGCAHSRSSEDRDDGTPQRIELCQLDDDSGPISLGPPLGGSADASDKVTPLSTDLTTLVNTIALTLYLMNPAAPAPPSIVVGPVPPTLP